MDNKRNILNNIIDQEMLKIVFQPIVSLKNGIVLGYEALSRATYETNFESIEDLFLMAKKENRLWELERLSREKTLEAAKSFMTPPFSKKLFMNVSPQIMKNEEFGWELSQFFHKEFRISPHNIIFEVTEKNIIDNLQGVQSTISQYKSDNYKFAIDDAGIEFSGLSAISDVEPNYIKLDMDLIRNIHLGSLQSAIVKGMVEYSKTANVKLIAEGIETYEELETVIKLGVPYAQGYYIQKPDEEILEIEADLVQHIQRINAVMIEEERNKVRFTPTDQATFFKDNDHFTRHSYYRCL